MKKIFTLLLGLSTLIGLYAEPTVVYLKTGGAGDGTSPESAVSTLDAAFDAIGDEGGTIVICGSFTQSANYPSGTTLKKHTGEVLITANYGGVDYRTTAGAKWINSKAIRFQLGGPVRFKDIDIEATTAKNFLIVCNFNEFTMDEGTSSTGYKWDAIGTALTVLGGCQDNLNNACGENPKINIKGGEVRVAAFNRGSGCGSTVSPGTAEINISGGIIHNLFTGSHTKNVIGGATNLNISGGKFVDHIYGGSYSTDYFGAGTQKMVVTGGDFSECKRIYFTKYKPDQIIDIDIADAGASEFTVLVELNRIDNIDRLTTNYKVPGKVTVEGESFTASNGITIPYRIYVPEEKTVEKLPLLTYFHDNGSRGTDNISHMYTQGSACLYTYMNFGDPCVVIAPQCPDEYVKDGTPIEGLWIERDKYVAGPAYSTEAPQADYLAAASELIDHVAAKYDIDADRLYLGGASNGAGAVWDMIVRNPGKFAAAVPVAGGGRDVTPESAAPYGEIIAQTPVWTFHGDADATLPINGTICLVDAAKAAGAQDITFITIPGGTHNIWNDAALTPGLAEWMFSKSKSSNAIEAVHNDEDVKIIPVKGGVVITTGNQSVSTEVFSADGCKIAVKDSVYSSNIEIGTPGIYVVVVKGTTGSVTKKICI